jgi:hypothetical protein
MISKKLFKKGQELPLNTIVIAILVIIVLLVIVVFFTTKMGDSGDSMEQNNPTKCTSSNPALTTMGYKDIEIKTDEKADSLSCGDKERISIIPQWKTGEGDDIKYNICCGVKE